MSMLVLILAVLMLGLALAVIEAHVASYGILGTLGLGAIMAAVVLSVTASGGSLALALAVTLPMAAAAGVVGTLAVRKALATRHQRVQCGAEGLIGHVGVVRRPLDPLGHVVVDGELWRARRSWVEEDDPVPGEGEAVVVDRVQGLTLSVRRAEIWEVET
jgi:membrane-bound ClpP family serine protease